MMNFFLTLICISLISTAANADAKWIPLKPLYEDNARQSDLNKTILRPKNSIIDNLDTMRKLLDKRGGNEPVNSDHKAWFSIDESE